MSKVIAGRMTAAVEGDFVVFLIGMRFNRPWHLVKSMYAFTAMPKMLDYLRRRPELGLMHATLTFGAGGPMVIQYWRSREQLEQFARSAAAPHQPAWKTWNRLIGYQKPDVGIWHETYLVKAGDHESLYANMPRFGLAQAGEHRPLGRRHAGAEQPQRQPSPPRDSLADAV